MADILETREVAGTKVGILNQQGGRDQQQDFFFTTENVPLDPVRTRQLINRAYKHTADKFADKQRTGSTSVTAIVTPDHAITTAHLGDSQAVLFVRDHITGHVTARELTELHNYDNPVERTRVEEATNGNFHEVELATKVEGGRLKFPLTKMFGNKVFAAISATPDITRYKIGEFAKHGDQVLLAIGSDGVFNKEKGLPADVYAALIEANYGIDENPTVQQLAEKIAKLASKHTHDNKTLLLTELPNKLSKTMIIGVCDGHGGHDVAQEAAESLRQEFSRELELPKGRVR